MNKDILSYFYFTGETCDGDYLEFSFETPMTQSHAEKVAKKILQESGGHLDAWFAETDEFAFDVEV